MFGSSLRYVAGVGLFLGLVGCTVNPPRIPLPTPQVNTHLYTTWPSLEVDSCAAAWLIERFVDDKATFGFVAEGEPVTSGTPFDLPGATWTRTHSETTYESIVRTHQITDRAVNAIAVIVHRVEIDYWDISNDPQTRRVDADIQQIVQDNPDPQQALTHCRTYFAYLYQTLHTSPE